jgi:hypothetical protein
MERPFDYVGSQSDIVYPQPHHLVRASAESIRSYSGDLGEYITTITLYYAPSWWDAADIDEVVSERFEPEHCQHSHDCCGRYYAGRGKVVAIWDDVDDNGDTAKAVLVRIRYTQNI